MYNTELFDLDEIESIDFIDERTTIDINVDEEHMFFANDIYTHNSGFGSELVDIAAIGKAIEPFQVADVLITFSQTKTEAAENKCKAFLIKNRLGKKFILLSCFYDPNMCVFDEIERVDDILLLTDDQKKAVQNTAAEVRAKLQRGDFDKKKTAA